MMKVFTRQFLQLPKNTASAAKWPLMMLVMLLTVGVSNGQVSLTSASTYNQDFNTLALSGTSSTLPTGWLLSETGTGANTTYAAGTGSDNGGNTYSFGAASNSERAFGTLLSGSVTSTIGASFTNNTGTTITEIAIGYTGEMWRLGVTSPTEADRLDFQYSLNATTLTSGTWTDINNLDFSTPNLTGTFGLRDGNNASFQTALSFTITGLNIANGATFYIRWAEYNKASSDDGLAVDNFSLTPTLQAVTPPVVTSETFTGNVGAAFSAQVQATNSPTSYAFTGTLPAGLSFSTSTGAITGTPTATVTEVISVTATNGGGASTPANISLQIDPGNQTISFGPLADVTYGDADFNLTATASSGLPITYFSSNPFVATVSGNTVTIVGAGTTTITATQDGNANYNAAPEVGQELEVLKATQTITFNALPDKTTADADFTLTASSTSGLPISYSSGNTAVATIIAPNTLHIVGPGTSTITASQAGDDNYFPATPVNQDQFISNASLQNQTITFPAIPNGTYGDGPVTMNATASPSGLTVTYSSDDPNVATVSGNTLIITGVGTATITASQAGNGSYNPAPDETQSFTVDPKNLTITGVIANDKDYDGTPIATLDLTGAALVGVVGADDVTVSSTGAAFVSPNAGPNILVNTNLVLGGADAGNYTLTQPTVTATINPAPQVITFNALPAATTATAPIDLNTYASVNSPNTITYASSDDLVASVSGNILTINGPGTATITAFQNGGGNYAAATPVDQSITVTLAPSTVTWNFGTTSAAPFPSSGLPVNNLDVSAFQQGNNANTGQTTTQINQTSASTAPFSGQFNVSTTAENADFNPMASAYFEFTLTPDPGYNVTLNDLDFAQRSTSTGPTEIAIRTSADGFASNLAVLTPNNNSVWALQNATFTPLTSTSALTVRIYGYQPGGSGSVGSSSANNWRLDDVTVTMLVEQLPACTGTPEAGTIAALDNDFCGTGTTDITATGFTDPNTTPGISLQWYSSTDNVNFLPVDGATSATLVTGMLSQTTYYYFQVTCSASSLSDVSETETITINAVPATPTISGSTTVCGAGTTTITSSAAPAGGTYAWTENGNPRPETTQSIVAGAGTYTVTINSAEGCPSASSAPFEILSQGAPAAPFVQGPTNVCQYVGTGTQVIYTVLPDPNVTSYTWVVPPTVNIVGGQGTGTLTVTFLNGFIQLANKQLRVTGTSSCGTTPMTIKYLVAQMPVTPSSITGPTNVCDLIGTATTATYSVPLVPGASDYNWTLPAGVTLVNDNGNSIEVSFTNAFATSSISVNASNDCGVSNNRSIVVSRISPSTPGLISGSTNVCMFKPTASNPTGTPATFSVVRASNVTTYNWTAPAGANITNQTSTATEDIITVQFTAAYTTGGISVTASNNCGTSPARTLALSSNNPATPSAIDVVNTQTCPNRVVTYSLSGMPANATDLVWTAPAGGTIQSGQGTSSIQVAYTSGAIDGQVSVVASNGCANSGTRSVSVKLAACPPAPKQAVKTTPAVSGVEVEVLDAGIFPNPSTTDFRLKVRSTAKGNIQVRVFDATGVAHSKMIVAPGETISFGQNLKAGSYFVEVIQGTERKVSRIVKL